MSRRRFRWLRQLRRALLEPLRRALRPPDHPHILRRLDVLERNVTSLFALQHADEQADADPRLRLRSREFKTFSQNGEDGLLLYLFSQVGSTSRRFVEFGIQDGHECCCANLAIHFGWSGLFMEREGKDVEEARRWYHDDWKLDPKRVRIEQAHVSPENIESLLAAYAMNSELDLLVVDIDSFDFWVWKAICGAAPRVVVIEYNSSLGASDELVVPYSPDLDPVQVDPLYHGASLAALARLGREKGYALVGCESSGANAFFVRRDLLGGELRELTPEQAWYPEWRRDRRLSLEAQRARVRELDFRAP